MAERRGVDVNIMGREFTVSCADDEREGLINSVNYLEKKMREIRDSGKVIGVERIAIMAALNLTHELLTTRSDGIDVGDMKRRMSDMQAKIDELLTEQSKLF